MKLFSKKKTDVDVILLALENRAKEEGSDLITELLKLLPGKPKKSGVDSYKGYIIEIYSCPSCGSPVGDEMMTFDYCPHCGKRMK